MAVHVLMCLLLLVWVSMTLFFHSGAMTTNGVFILFSLVFPFVYVTHLLYTVSDHSSEFIVIDALCVLYGITAFMYRIKFIPQFQDEVIADYGIGDINGYGTLTEGELYLLLCAVVTGLIVFSRRLFSWLYNEAKTLTHRNDLILIGFGYVFLIALAVVCLFPEVDTQPLGSTSGELIPCLATDLSIPAIIVYPILSIVSVFVIYIERRVTYSRLIWLLRFLPVTVILCSCVVSFMLFYPDGLHFEAGYIEVNVQYYYTVHTITLYSISVMSVIYCFYLIRQLYISDTIQLS